MKRFIEGTGMIAVLIGFGGIAGAIELETSLVRPLLVIGVGALMLMASKWWEVRSSEKNVIGSYIHNSNVAIRPSYLRK